MSIGNHASTFPFTTIFVINSGYADCDVYKLGCGFIRAKIALHGDNELTIYF